ncbi:hypothetical protein KEC55_25285 [Burkholderia cepacia]|uniref:hypothetical protein n=1 Tax=Burkholderia cepacia TaxID=292 RepID=UPI00249DAC5D|nr:hypothetical protein [Burkholderia cepacia]WGY70358.1 hypothetical protein KEC55_25285 [Burkholderia cepacia]
MNYSTHGSTSGKKAGGVAPMLEQNDSGSDSATTKSGVSAGTVTITDSASQKQDVASLNRDTTNTNGTVAKLPDMQNLLSNQADMMAAAGAVGEAVSRRIGDYADKMMKDAAANGDQAGVDAWKEGGANRALMQGAGAALVTGLAGGNAVGGAAVAAIASGKLSELSGALASAPTPFAPLFAQIAFGATVVGVGADAVGQIVSPNVGQYGVGSLLNTVSNAASEKYPLLGPVINGVSNSVNNSDISNRIQGILNSYWQGVVKDAAGKAGGSGAKN